VFYLRDGEELVVCNVRPPGERTNPWPQNLDHQPAVEVTVEGHRQAVTARRATGKEVDRLWPELTRIWPLYADNHRHTKERHIFVLTPGGTPDDDAPRFGFPEHAAAIARVLAVGTVAVIRAWPAERRGTPTDSGFPAIAAP
jgi:deazaflavin-dependent oxidoreductase (nitroreductase family)